MIYNFFSLGIIQLVTSLLQLLVIPFVIARIGVGGFGVVALAQVVMFYLSAITEYGFSQTATREVSIYRGERVLLASIFFRVLFCRLLLCLFSFLILLLLLLVVPIFKAHVVLYLAGFTFVAGQAVLINWFLQGVEKIQLMALLSLVSRVFFVIAVFLFIRSSQEAVLYLFFLGMANFSMGIIAIFIVIKTFRLQFILPKKNELIREFRNGWQITATNLANSICQYANIFILRLFTNDLVTGYFSVAERIFMTLRQLIAVFPQVAYPQVCLLLTGGREQILQYFKRWYRPFLLAVGGGSTLLFVLAPAVLHVFIGVDSFHSVTLLRVLAGTLLIITLGIPGSLLLLAFNQRQKYFRIYLAGALVNLVLNLFLSRYYHSEGTVTAILVTELFLMLVLNRAAWFLPFEVYESK